MGMFAEQQLSITIDYLLTRKTNFNFLFLFAANKQKLLFFISSVFCIDIYIRKTELYIYVKDDTEAKASISRI
jgi:hypothetical protein